MFSRVAARVAGKIPDNVSANREEKDMLSLAEGTMRGITLVERQNNVSATLRAATCRRWVTVLSCMSGRRMRESHGRVHCQINLPNAFLFAASGKSKLRRFSKLIAHDAATESGGIAPMSANDNAADACCLMIVEVLRDAGKGHFVLIRRQLLMENAARTGRTPGFSTFCSP